LKRLMPYATHLCLGTVIVGILGVALSLALTSSAERDSSPNDGAVAEVFTSGSRCNRRGRQTSGGLRFGRLDAHNGVV
jgi:hypothetical protein